MTNLGLFDDGFQIVGFIPSEQWYYRSDYTRYDWTELHQLATVGKAELFMDWFYSHTLEDLVNKINVRDDIMEYTPIMIAIDSVDLDYDEIDPKFPYDDWAQRKNASYEERLKFITTLIQFGAYPNPSLDYGPSPLMAAALKDFSEAIYLLVLNHGAYVNAVYFDDSPLTCAIRNGAVRSVRALIELNADVNSELRYWKNTANECIYGFTPLHFAAAAIGKSLHVSVMPFIVCNLLSAGADPYATNSAGQMATDLSSCIEFQNIVLFFRRKGLYYVLKQNKFSFLVVLHREISKFL